MKKILLTLSLALATAIVIPSAASAQDVATEKKAECTQTCSKDKKECKDFQKCKDGKECKKDCKSKKACKGKKGKGKKAKGNHRHQADCSNCQNPLFNGITLSADQQQKFQALREKQNAERKADLAQQKADKAKQKAANAEQRKMKAEAFDKEVEKILTPEQYNQYKANKESMDKNRRGPRR